MLISCDRSDDTHFGIGTHGCTYMYMYMYTSGSAYLVMHSSIFILVYFILYSIHHVLLHEHTSFCIYTSAWRCASAIQYVSRGPKQNVYAFTNSKIEELLPNPYYCGFAIYYPCCHNTKAATVVITQ